MIFIGMPVSPVKQLAMKCVAHKPSEGSIKVLCRRCQDFMWLGPKQQQALKTAGDQDEIVCAHCLMPELLAKKAKFTTLGGTGGTYITSDGGYYGPDGSG